MAKAQQNHAFKTLLFTIFTCQILLAQGRHLVNLQKPKFSSNVNNYVGESTKRGGIVASPELNDAGENKEYGPSSFTAYESACADYLTKEHPPKAESDVVNPNGTNPGQSPGVGHRFPRGKEAKFAKQSHF